MRERGQAEGAERLSDWQPIDTAPKDGTRVLLFMPASGDGRWTGFWLDGDGRVSHGRPDIL